MSAQISFVIQPGQTKINVRFADNEGYNSIITDTLSLEQALPVLDALDESLGTKSAEWISRVISDNVARVEKRIHELEIQLVNLKESIGDV